MGGNWLYIHLRPEIGKQSTNSKIEKSGVVSQKLDLGTYQYLVYTTM